MRCLRRLGRVWPCVQSFGLERPAHPRLRSRRTRAAPPAKEAEPPAVSRALFRSAPLPARDYPRRTQERPATVFSSTRRFRAKRAAIKPDYLSQFGDRNGCGRVNSAKQAKHRHFDTRWRKSSVIVRCALRRSLPDGRANTSFIHIAGIYPQYERGKHLCPLSDYDVRFFVAVPRNTRLNDPGRPRQR